MKKNSVLFTILLVMAMILMLARGIASTGLGLSNPVHASTREEAEQASGQWLPSLPDDTSDVVYSYIDASADDPNSTVIAQASFIWKGTRCILRVASATELKDIAGMHYTWAFERNMRIGIYDGLVKLTEGGPAVALWYDLRNGAAHSLSMDADASLEKLMTLCNLMAEWEQEDPPPLSGGEKPESRILSFLGFAELSSTADIAKALATDLKVPNGADSLTYYIVTRAVPHPLVAARYTLEGVEYVLFAQRGKEAAEPSGIAVSWKNWEIDNKHNLQLVMSYNPEEEGLITWFDSVRGINFSLCTTHQASNDILLTMVDSVIVKH